MKIYKENYIDYLNPNDIKSLTLISSEGCNLNCSYCSIANSSKENNNAKVKKAFEDGSFLKNILLTFSNLQIPLENIKRLELWGQEPTLTLNEVTNFFPELYKNFSNINNLFFSTNGMDHFDRIIKLIEQIDKTVSNEFTINIQISNDGTLSTDKYRKAHYETIMKNTRNLILSLNEIVLNKVNIGFHFHGVLALDLLHDLLKNPETNIKKYWNEWGPVLSYFHDLVKNPKVHFGGWGPTLEFPTNATKEDGQKLTEFFKYCKKLYPKENKTDFIPYEHMLEAFAHSFECGLLEVMSKQRNTIEDIVYNLANYDFIDEKHNYLKMFNDPMYCGGYRGNLKIRYDGTLLHCQNVVHLLDLDSKELDKENLPQELQTAKMLIKKNRYPNFTNYIIKPEDYKVFYCSNVNFKQSFGFTYSNMVNIMKILRDSNQIDISYNNNDVKLLRHAFWMCYMHNCLDATLRLNGSVPTQYIGTIRFFCNGFLDIFEEFFETLDLNYEDNREKRKKERD